MAAALSSPVRAGATTQRGLRVSSRAVKPASADRKTGWALLGAALVAFGVYAAQKPDTGLVRRTFSDDTFSTEISSVIDRRIHFGDALHPKPRWVGDQAAVRWEGFVDAPRAGQYVFKLTSDDGAWLWLDGKQVLDNGGIHPPKTVTRDLFLEKGPHPIRIDYLQQGGGATMRLEWRLPSGYNVPGLLPISSLHPHEPAPEGFGTRALATLPWLLVLASLLAFNRRALLAPRDAAARQALLAGALVTAVALGARLVDLNGAGETCDEWAYVGGGKIYAENLFAGVFDAEQWKINREHPAVGKLIYGFVQEALGDAPWTTRAASAVMGAITVLVCFLLTRRLFGTGAAVAAGLVLSLLPPFLAHGKVAALDSPATMLQAIAMWLFLRAVHDPAVRTRSLWWFTLVAGLAVATKLTNGLVVIFAFGVWLLLQWRQIRDTRAVTLPLPMFLLPVLAVAPFFLTWPWLWQATSEHLRETLNHWVWRPPELFLGEMMRPPPPSYFTAAFLATTPALLFIPFLVGAAQLFRRDLTPLVRMPEDADTSRRVMLLLVVAWVLMPFAWSFSHFRQDGIRYVHAAYVPFASLCGLGLRVVARWIARNKEALLPRVMAGLTAAFTIYLGVACVRIHPYYLDYYNELVGGPARVWEKKLFETAWWGEGMDRAIEWVNENAPEKATWGFRGVVDHTLADLRRDLVPRKHRPDFLIRTDFANNTEETPGYEQVFRVDAQGAPIAAVYKRVR